jgi:hypothetical protein
MGGFAQQVMKKLVLTIFLAIFCTSVIGRSVERTVEWASQHAHDFGHSSPVRGTARMGEARKHTPWQVHTKLLQSGSLAVSFARTWDPQLPESAIHHAPATFISDPNSRVLSSRAPPSLI